MDLKIQFDWHVHARKLKDGKIIIYSQIGENKKRIGYLYFSVQETQICADTIQVTEEYRGRGFGRLLMMILMALSDEVKKPIFLYATEESEGFYRRLGMRPLFHHEAWQDVTVEFMNLNPEKKFCEQCSDLDYVWIPPRMTRIQIYL